MFYYFDNVNNFYLMSINKLDNKYLNPVTEEEYLAYLESLETESNIEVEEAN